MIVWGQQFETEYKMTIIDGEDNPVLSTDSVFASCNLESVVFFTTFGVSIITYRLQMVLSR